MRLRSFTAPDMASAVREIRDALGDDAVIVSSRPTGRGKGVLVTVAAPEPEAVAEAGDGEDDDTVVRALEAHGVPLGLAARLAAASNGPGDAAERLSRAVAREIGFEPLLGRPSAPGILLIGPPGAGKTSVAAKIAARRALVDEGVRVVAADGERAGAYARLAEFTTALGIDLVRATRAHEIARVIEATPEGTLVVIDGPAANPFDSGELAAAAALADGVPVEPVLVLASGTDPFEAAETGSAFAGLGVHRLIATRLDAALRLGGVLAAADGGRLRLAGASASPFVAHALAPFGARTVARLLLSPPGGLRLAEEAVEVSS